ncbi:MAG TPA: tetratricopeptide repeat protein, partial [Myxococcaceae bacterium]|nr:tetratricopeptide repeat protein [Myxococcaceae bacterium]
MRAARERARELEKRVARLEGLDALNRAPGGPVSSGPGSTRDVPSLTVVKVKPRYDAAPKLDTQTSIAEPPPEAVESLMELPDRESGGARAGGTATTTGDDDAPEVDPAILEKQYNDGVAALRTGNVEGGIARLRAFAQENPRHPQADNALYFSGLGMMGMGDHEEAAQLFASLVEQFPAGDAVVEATLRLAECRERLKNVTDAKALYTRVITRYPGTAAAT